MLKHFNTTKIYFLAILIGALIVRLYGINWDQGYHLHPDERAIVMFTTPLQFPADVKAFFSPQSTWNPHFFAYGSFPMYFLKIISSGEALLNPIYAMYEGINLVGRVLSVLFDIGTLITLFFLAKKLFNKTVALFAIFFYATGVLPIQLSHFYAVDTPLTFFILLTLFTLITFYEKPTFYKALLVGILFGFSLATKTSALVLLMSIGVTISADFLLLFVKNIHRVSVWIPHITPFFRKLLLEGVLIIAAVLATFAILEPYAFIDFPEFWQQNMQQAAMTKDAYTFPYTLQYVGKIPYFYELKNVFLWGQGPFLAIFSFAGGLYFTYLAFKKEKKEKWAQEVILVVFFWAYFLTVGKFAIGFMRYLLPLYPLLSLFAAVLFFRLLKFIPRKVEVLFIIAYLFLITIWPLSFISIYHEQNTRVIASQWIRQHISYGKTLAIEHWDDRLPLFDGEKYSFVELTLYDQPDDDAKWTVLNEKLKQADYIIIASNRLYVPLQKMADCTVYERACYPKTAEYYKQLFNGSLGFEKVAEFSTVPVIPFLPYIINDQSADESFTVYDHPKVLIYKRR